MSNVKPFQRYQMHNIPNALRLLAEQLEADPDLAVRCVVVLEQEDGELDYRAFGAEPFTRAHAIGLLEVAKREIVP